VDNFIDGLIEKSQKNRTFDREKAIEQIVKQVVLSVCDAALMNTNKVCLEIANGKSICPKPIHCEECVLQYLKDQLQGK
jgi:hypothetical protein